MDGELVKENKLFEERREGGPMNFDNYISLFRMKSIKITALHPMRISVKIENF